ncbi:MAG: CocE/NonD family hydrolase [Candidatus Aminicenantes bacterium]|nr:MAG: CocE/NonD family hydrolase [Candidatus Aminicenantes bacterium]
MNKGALNEKDKPGSKSTSTMVYPPGTNTWTMVITMNLGNIQFGEKTGVYFREKVELPFFLYHLKGKGKPDLPEALVFETGSNQWKSYDRWPPKAAAEKNLYFHADKKLSFALPGKEPEKAFDSYTSDPDNPVPWSTRKHTRQGHLWMVEEQRFAAKRPDVLVYQSHVLTEDITIAGPIIASLYVSTTGSDADWIVKLIDVYPEDAPGNQSNSIDDKMSGYQMLLAGEVFRGKYRNSFEKPEPMVPNQVTKIEFDLRDRCHCFLKGHRIMVQVQSTWFPVIDRNPQKFTDIYHAKEEDFQKAVHKVYRSGKFPSHLKIKVMN